MSSPLRVRVPASTSNIGPGFDVFGCAFRLHNTFTVERAKGDASDSRIEFTGPRCKGLRPSPRNIFFLAAERYYQRIGRKRPRLRVQCNVEVPNARGLGSSSTAIAGALVACNALEDEPLTRHELVELAAAIEGHPDNIVPALMGGLSASLYDPASGKVMVHRIMPHDSIRFVVFVPDYEVPTSEARRVLPERVALRDAVANAARLPLLLDALEGGNLAHMRILTEDRWHEPFRAPLYRKLDVLRSIGFEAGAASVTVSGAGPTMLAICPKDAAPQVESAWSDAAGNALPSGTTRTLDADPDGATQIDAVG